MYVVAQYGHLEVVRALVGAGAGLLERALWVAKRNDRPDLVTLLLTKTPGHGPGTPANCEGGQCSFVSQSMLEDGYVCDWCRVAIGLGEDYANCAVCAMDVCGVCSAL